MRPLLRGDADMPPADDPAILSRIGNIWQGRSDRYSELRALREPDPAGTDAPRRVEMSYIGG
jgi:cyclic pyranopterin phosphate synthase